jgi:hypothetical protein
MENSNIITSNRDKMKNIFDKTIKMEMFCVYVVVAVTLQKR